jgi:two-component system cell cycle response regulator DivK
MPGVDGLDAMQQLKGNGATAGVPVIALSGDMFSADRARAAGCDAFLLKPVRPVQLLDVIDRLLANRVPDPPRSE